MKWTRRRQWVLFRTREFNKWFLQRKMLFFLCQHLSVVGLKRVWGSLLTTWTDAQQLFSFILEIHFQLLPLKWDKVAERKINGLSFSPLSPQPCGSLLCLILWRSERVLDKRPRRHGQGGRKDRQPAVTGEGLAALGCTSPLLRSLPALSLPSHFTSPGLSSLSVKEDTASFSHLVPALCL